MKKIISICVFVMMLMTTSQIASAQAQEIQKSSKKTNFSIATNLMEWLNFATPSLDLGVAVHRNITLNAGVRLNAWEFRDGKNDVSVWNKQQTCYGGLRYWPWYAYSGFWTGFKGQFSKASNTGIWRSALESYTSAGVGLSLGYTLMLNTHLNLDFGVGAWGGRHFVYSVYDCPEMHELREDGARNFLKLDEISVSLGYVF